MGTYAKTCEGMSQDIEGNFIPDFLEQVTGTHTIEQHGSLLKVTDDEGTISQGSTIGNNIMLSTAGYYEELEGMGKIRFEGVATGMIEEGTQGPEIFLNWIWRIYDSDNNLLVYGAGTQVLKRTEE